METRIGTPGHVVVHVSDLHLTPRGTRLHGTVESAERLDELLDGLEELAPDAIVLTGDLVDDGSRELYRELRTAIERWAKPVGAAVVWVMGNHDDRRAFSEVLLDREPTDVPLDAVADVRGLRIITLDSSVPGEGHGELRDSQLEWLSTVLADPAPHGSLLAMHHPPIRSPLGLLQTLGLREPGHLAGVIRGSDIRAILAGHFHHTTSGIFAGIPVSVAGSTAYTQDVRVEYPGLRGVDGAQGFMLVQVDADQVVHTLVPVARHPIAVEIGPEDARRIIADHGSRS